MAISSVNIYNAVSENAYATRKKQAKDLSIEIGTGLNTKKDNMVGAVTINPKLLEKNDK